jgi:hypothetical protein
VVSEDPRVDRLLRRVEGTLDRATTHAAEERVWRRLREGHSVRGRNWTPAFVVFALALLLLVGGAYLGSYRLEVASGVGLVLYQEKVASTQIAQRSGVTQIVTGTLDIRQGHYNPTRPDLLRVVAIDDVRMSAGALPATIEIRYREQGSAVSGTLARTTGIEEVRRATGDARHNVIAPLPPVERGEVRRFEVWVHVDSAAGPVESGHLLVEVRGAAEGERARAIDAR